MQQQLQPNNLLLVALVQLVTPFEFGNRIMFILKGCWCLRDDAVVRTRPSVDSIDLLMVVRECICYSTTCVSLLVNEFLYGLSTR